jgi:hypothetical protein
MVDVPAALKDLLYSNWVETDPEIADVKFCTQDIGMDSGKTSVFDPNAISPQVGIEEPEILNERLNDELYKRTHTISILVYLKPVNYQPATVAAAMETFRNMIEQIDDILKTYKWTTTDLTDIQLSTWRIQTRKQDEPIILAAAQEIKTVYYPTSGGGGGD